MPIKFNTVTWYSKLGAVILFILVVPVLAFYIGMKYEETMSLIRETKPIEDAKFTPESAQTDSSPDILNATYIIEDENITLVDGVSGDFHIFGQPSIGDLNNDGKADAISFLYQETSGTGTFFFAVAVVSEGNGYKGTNTVFLGDRIAPQTINFTEKKGIVAVNYATRREDEPMTTEPSVGVTKYVKVVDGELVEGR